MADNDPTQPIDPQRWIQAGSEPTDEVTEQVPGLDQAPRDQGHEATAVSSPASADQTVVTPWSSEPTTVLPSVSDQTLMTPSAYDPTSVLPQAPDPTTATLRAPEPATAFPEVSGPPRQHSGSEPTRVIPADSASSPEPTRVLPTAGSIPQAPPQSTPVSQSWAAPAAGSRWEAQESSGGITAQRPTGHQPAPSAWPVGQQPSGQAGFSAPGQPYQPPASGPQPYRGQPYQASAAGAPSYQGQPWAAQAWAGQPTQPSAGASAQPSAGASAQPSAGAPTGYSAPTQGYSYPGQPTSGAYGYVGQPYQAGPYPGYGQGQPPSGQYPGYGYPGQVPYQGQPATKTRRGGRAAAAVAVIVLVVMMLVGGSWLYRLSGLDLTGSQSPTIGQESQQGSQELPTGQDDSGQEGSSQDEPTSTRVTEAQATGVVLINAETTSGMAAGTGMILSADGRVLTNYHVVAGSTAVEVEVVTSGDTYQASVVGFDQSRDVALLQLDNASGLSTVTVDTDEVAVGDQVAAVGNADGRNVLSRANGEVTALDQSLTVSSESPWGATEDLSGMIQTDAGAVPGDSGGPMYDAEGEVLGMTTAGSTNEGTSYAVPIETALSIVSTIESGQDSGTVRVGPAGYLGILVADATRGSSTGRTITQVVDGSPADQAGITAGSTLIQVGDSEITSSTNLATVIRALEPGARVKVQWIAPNGTSKSATVTLTESPVN